MRDPSSGPCAESDCPYGAPAGEEPTDLRIELARANLLRMRGEYASARDACLSVLKRYPGDHTAHTLLGDVHAEWGELDQAAQWYELALDLAPDSAADRQKMEAVQKRLHEREAAETARQLGLPTTRPKALRFALSTASFIVVVAVVAYWIGAGGRSARASTPQVVADVVDVGPAAKESIPPKADVPLTREEAPPGPPAVATPAVGVDDEALRTAKQRCVFGSAIVAAMVDPRTGDVWITVESSTDQDPRQVATDLAQSALQVFPSAQKITVRVLREGRVAFVADAPRVGDPSASEQGVTSPLTNEWPANNAGPQAP